MTDSARYAEAREALARWLCEKVDEHDWEDVEKTWICHTREYFALADALLSLKDPNGKPLIVVPSADQRLPNCRLERASSKASPWVTGYEKGYKIGYKESQDDMLTAGFMKVEKP